MRRLGESEESGGGERGGISEGGGGKRRRFEAWQVDGFTVYKAPLNLVASKLLGPHGSRAKVTFMRGSVGDLEDGGRGGEAKTQEQITLDLERRMTDMQASRCGRLKLLLTGMQAAQKAVSQAKESSGLDKIRYAHETLGN